MKVGIVTIYDTENMGNRLQNYALQQALSKYADQVLTLRNKPKVESALANRIHASFLAESAPLNRLLGKRRKAKLLQFNRQFLRLSRTCYWYNDPSASLKSRDRCDLYCAGSDQVWNPFFERSGMFSYLGFADSDRTFSYAASFGIDAIPEEFTGDVRVGLAHIPSISVREDAGRAIVQKLTGRTDAQVLIDPTMLLTGEEWDRVACAPTAPLPQSYILLYFLGELSQQRQQAIARKAEQLHCQVINLLDRRSPFYNIGPGEFLYLIKHAAMVCTDSFHGSVFSFLWQRPLVIFDRIENGAGMGSRLKTFAGKFHLEDRLAKQDGIPEEADAADYSAGLAILEAEREKAYAFLSGVFRSAGQRESQSTFIS